MFAPIHYYFLRIISSRFVRFGDLQTFKAVNIWSNSRIYSYLFKMNWMGWGGYLALNECLRCVQTASDISYCFISLPNNLHSERNRFPSHWHWTKSQSVRSLLYVVESDYELKWDHHESPYCSNHTVGEKLEARKPGGRFLQLSRWVVLRIRGRDG